MSNRTFYATNDNNELIVAFQKNYGLSPFQVKLIKDHCTRIFIDSMGNGESTDWAFSNENMKKWLADEYGIKLPLLVINEKYEDDLYDGITNALDPQTATKKFSKSKCVYGRTKQFSKCTKLEDIDDNKYYVIAAPHHISGKIECWVNSGEEIFRFYNGESLPGNGFYPYTEGYDSEEDAIKAAKKTGYTYVE